MTRRKELSATLQEGFPRSVSWIARELGLKRRDAEEELRHAIRSARAEGHRGIVDSARCRACGFAFESEKLSKPGRCPMCRSGWIFEAQIRIEPTTRERGDSDSP